MSRTDLKELMNGFGNQLLLVAGKMPNCMETGWFCIVWQPLWGRGGLVSVLRDIDASSLAQLFHRIHACYNQLFLAVVPTISSSSQIMYFLSLSQHPHKMISNTTNFAKEGVKITRVHIRRQNILGGKIKYVSYLRNNYLRLHFPKKFHFRHVTWRSTQSGVTCNTVVRG